ncbi:MAG: helix-turn-helix transcriptional regulator [Bryobacterales bacterium]|nr:helix-turn-helix transcriptional regulator [Bryobacterales bacterium]
MDNVDVLLTADIRAAARLANLSVPHFRYLFRLCTGAPYAAWIKQRRLEAAVQLLQRTRLTIPQICAKIGVQDISHFSRSFKRLYGIPPAAHRRNSHSHDRDP